MRAFRALLLAGLLVTATASDVITVHAAASATDALGALAASYGAAHAVTVRCSFAASATLARQIELGAPADVVLTAEARWLDMLQARGLIQPASRRDLLGNRLVIVAPRARPLTLRVAAEVDFPALFAGRLAIGDPDSVPAGAYAREALIALGWWSRLRERLAPCADVRAALRLVELGEADAGIVYWTDALRSTAVVVAADIPSELHAPIRYPAALTSTAGPAAAAFLAWLGGPEAAAVWTRHGFIPLAVTP